MNGLNEGAWKGDWTRRLAERIQASGHADLRSLLSANRDKSYEELAELLGEGIAPVQVQTLEAVEAPSEDVTAAAVEALARFLRASLPNGWGGTRYWESSALGALARWEAIWSKRVTTSGAAEALFRRNPPLGWRPQDGADLLLRGLL
ncbi:MAG: hypothetical protein IPP07_24000 [Holophagales bacterium]|nr:hypothetical protein [Holophagales bacterium]MBK9967771.1 hypothetical protein [Holophagales bacterium]